VLALPLHHIVEGDFPLGDAGRAIDVRLEQCEADTPLSCSAPASLLIPGAGLALR
jgi:hypothetical protein